MKTLHYSLIIAIFMLAFFFTFYMENSHDVRATCFTINGTEECSTLPPLLTSIKSHYVPNETIQLVGAFSPNTMIQIDLVDPNDNIKNSVLVQSDSSGSFQSKMVVPNDAVNGTWKINTSSGLNHSTHYITVISKKLQDNQTNPNHSIPVTLTQSPLKQFKSGIKAQDVKCDQDLQLVIKSEDGSPACVKPEHLTRLSQYGWTIPNLKIIGDTDTTNNNKLSENNCGQFHTIPENKSDSNGIPVLILKQNSIGCAKITFTVNFLFNNTNDCIGCNSQMVKTAEFLSIGKYNFSRHGDLISGSSGKDYTNSFQIASVPKTVDVSKYPIGSNFTVVFIIKPLQNATGFYDYSIVKPVCNAYPLAVGYSPDQVNSSDFSEGLSFMQNHPCVMGSYGYSEVQVSGISYVQMKLN